MVLTPQFYVPQIGDPRPFQPNGKIPAQLNTISKLRKFS